MKSNDITAPKANRGVKSLSEENQARVAELPRPAGAGIGQGVQNATQNSRSGPSVGKPFGTTARGPARAKYGDPATCDRFTQFTDTATARMQNAIETKPNHAKEPSRPSNRSRSTETSR